MLTVRQVMSPINEDGKRVEEIPPLPEDKGQFLLDEVYQFTRVKPFVLSFWESEFPFLKPDKDGSGRIVYSRENVQAILEIKRLLYDEGCTLAAARTRLSREGRASPAARVRPEKIQPSGRSRPGEESAALEGERGSGSGAAERGGPGRLSEIRRSRARPRAGETLAPVLPMEAAATGSGEPGTAAPPARDRARRVTLEDLLPTARPAGGGGKEPIAHQREEESSLFEAGAALPTGEGHHDGDEVRPSIAPAAADKTGGEPGAGGEPKVVRKTVARKRKGRLPEAGAAAVVPDEMPLAEVAVEAPSGSRGKRRVGSAPAVEAEEAKEAAGMAAAPSLPSAGADARSAPPAPGDIPGGAEPAAAGADVLPGRLDHASRKRLGRLRSGLEDLLTLLEGDDRKR